MVGSIGVLTVVAVVAVFVYRRKKSEENKPVPPPKDGRPQWTKPELPGGSLKELEGTSMTPAELETSERIQELSNVTEHDERRR